MFYIQSIKYFPLKWVIYIFFMYQCYLSVFVYFSFPRNFQQYSASIHFLWWYCCQWVSPLCLHLVLGAVTVLSVPLQLPLSDSVSWGVVSFPEHLPEVEGTHVLVVVVSPHISIPIGVGGRRRSLLAGGVGAQHLAELWGCLHIGGGGRTAPSAKENETESRQRGGETIEVRTW